MTEGLLERLEAFQSELAKRVLKHHSNTAAVAVLDVPTMRCKVLLRKLGFLLRVIWADSGGLNGRVLMVLGVDVYSLCLMRKCRELEEWFGSNLTDNVLCGSVCSIKEVKKVIYELDKKLRMERCIEKAQMIAEVVEQIGWARLWDAALDC